MKTSTRLRAIAAMAALGPIIAGMGAGSASAKIGAEASAMQIKAGDARGLQQGSPSILQELFGVGGGGGKWKPRDPRYIKRPFHTVAQDKRRARKARNVRRHKKAMRG